MATEVVMPQMGESIAEGTITRWLVKVGEKVERDQPLFEISTDKVDAEIPSPAAAGRLRESAAAQGPRGSHLASVGVPRTSGRTCLSPAGASCAAARGAPGSEPSGTGESRRRFREAGARRPEALRQRGGELAKKT